MVEAIALIFSAIAVTGTIYVLWNGTLRPFNLNVIVQSVVWHPPLGGRSDTHFALAIPMLLSNRGARPGEIVGFAAILESHDTKKSYILDPIASVDIPTLLRVFPDGTDDEKAAAFIGMGVSPVVYLKPYGATEIAALFSFPSSDSQRYKDFDDPSSFSLGPYTLSIRCYGPSGFNGEFSWKTYTELLQNARPELMATVRTGQLVMNYDASIFNELKRDEVETNEIDSTQNS